MIFIAGNLQQNVKVKNHFCENVILRIGSSQVTFAIH